MRAAPTLAAQRASVPRPVLGLLKPLFHSMPDPVCPPRAPAPPDSYISLGDEGAAGVASGLRELTQLQELFFM
jgi:hypothetical protein